MYIYLVEGFWQKILELVSQRFSVGFLGMRDDASAARNIPDAIYHKLQHGAFQWPMSIK